MSVFSTGPSSVDEPSVAVELFHLGSEHFSVDCWVERQKGSSKTG